MGFAERNTGSGWVNFGGLRDPEDSTIEEAAAREVFEESMGIINLKPHDLSYMPYADLVSPPQLHNNGNHRPAKSNYRMFFHYMDYFSEQKFYDRLEDLKAIGADKHLIEMTNFKWVRLSDVMGHFTGAGPRPDTFAVHDSHGQLHQIKLFDPLVRMLSQQKVVDYYGDLVKEPVFDRTPVAGESHKNFHGQTYHFTQTESHLKLVLGDKYVGGDLKKNIEIFLKDFHDPFYAKEKKNLKIKLNNIKVS